MNFSLSFSYMSTFSLIDHIKKALNLEEKESLIYTDQATVGMFMQDTAFIQKQSLSCTTFEQLENLEIFVTNTLFNKYKNLEIDPIIYRKALFEMKELISSARLRLTPKSNIDANRV